MADLSSLSLKLHGKYGSLSDLEWNNIPMFAVITGPNGSGKSQLLEVLGGKLGVTQLRRVLETDQGMDVEISGTNYAPGEVFYSASEWIVHAGIVASQIEINRVLENAHHQTVSSGNPLVSAQFWELFTERTGLTQEQARQLSFEEFYALLNPSLLWQAVGNPQDLAFLFLSHRLMEAHLAALKVPQEEIQKRYGEPPWNLMNEVLKAAGLPYRVNHPPENLAANPLGPSPTFSLKLTDAEGAEIPFEGLSSGERVILSTALWMYQAQSTGLPFKMLLLDEPDAHLHPSLARRFLEVMQQVFVEARGVRVIMTTHSPSTVVFTPAESLFEMRREEPRIRLSPDKQATIALLTEGLVVVQESTRFVLTDGDDDPPFYSQVWQLLTQELPGQSPSPLAKTPGLAFIPSKGHKFNTHLIPKMRKQGLAHFHAISDLDEGNASSEGIHVIGRYCMENYLLDPINFFALMHSKGKHPEVEGLTLLRGQENTFSRRSDGQLQKMADAILSLITPTDLDPGETGLVNVEFVGGKQVKYPRWFMFRSGKDLRELMTKKLSFSPKNNDLLTSYATLALIPQELAAILREIQAS